MSKIMSSNEDGVFEDYRCVPYIYNDFYMSVEKYDGFLKVEYVYTRKNISFFVFILIGFVITLFYLCKEFDEYLICLCVTGLILLIFANYLSK